MRKSIVFSSLQCKLAAGPIAVLLVTVATLCLPTKCEGGVVVFGDSLSDTGNLFLASGGAPFLPVPGNRFPSPPFDTGSASNGPLWVEILADRLGQPAPSSALVGGTNYSFIGALTGTQVPSPFGVPSMTEQVGLHLLSMGGVVAPDDLYVLWGGANDFFFGQFDPFLAVSNLSGQIQALAGAGANEFLVPNLIPLNQTPSLAGTPAATGAAAFSQAFNSLLAAEIGTLRTDLGITIYELDVAGLFSEVSADPTQFGLTNVADPALSVDLSSSVPLFPIDVVGNPDEYLWWDGVHPTAAGHEIIGTRAASIVRPVPEPTSGATWALFILCVHAAVRRRTTRHRASSDHKVWSGRPLCAWLWRSSRAA